MHKEDEFLPFNLLKNWNNFFVSSQICSEIFKPLLYGDYFCK